MDVFGERARSPAGAQAVVESPVPPLPIRITGRCIHAAEGPVSMLRRNKNVCARGDLRPALQPPFDAPLPLAPNGPLDSARPCSSLLNSPELRSARPQASGFERSRHDPAGAGKDRRGPEAAFDGGGLVAIV